MRSQEKKWRNEEEKTRVRRKEVMRAKIKKEERITLIEK